MTALDGGGTAARDDADEIGTVHELSWARQPEKLSSPGLTDEQLPGPQHLALAGGQPCRYPGARLQVTPPRGRWYRNRRNVNSSDVDARPCCEEERTLTARSRDSAEPLCEATPKDLSDVATGFYAGDRRFESGWGY